MRVVRRESRTSRESRKKNQEQKVRQRANKLARDLAERAIESHLAPLIAPPASTKKSRFARTRKVLRWVYFVGAGAVGFYFGILPSAYPEVSVEHLERPNPANAFSVPFKIVNKSFFGLDDVRYSCLLIEGVSLGRNIRMRGLNFLPVDRPIGTLGWNKEAAGSCKFVNETFHLPDLKPIDFTVIVFFRPQFLPKRAWAEFRREFRFVATPGEDGWVVPNHRTGAAR